MGNYNTYGKVQIKVGEVLDNIDYKVGDKASIPDGIYVGYGGMIVIKDGIFIMEVDTLTDKWGRPLTSKHVLRGRGLSELFEKEETEPTVTTEKDIPPIEVTKPKEEVPKVEKLEETTEKKEEVVEKMEEKTEIPVVETKVKEATPEAPKEKE